MILVTGATGTVGREVVAQLSAAGHNVRVLTRNPSKAQFDARVQVVAGDFDKPETLTTALENVERVFSLSTGPQLATQEANLAQAAKKAGAQHIVKLSVLHASQARSGLAGWHQTAERAIQDTGIAWTFLQPGGFMSNALFWRDSIHAQGKVFSNYGDGRLAYIHPRDIAAVAVCALTQPGHEGKSYPLTGPQALTIGEQVQILSAAIGKPIEYVPVTDDAARAGMLRAGIPVAVVDALMPFGNFVRSGNGAEVLPTVEQVTHRKALTFHDWVSEHTAAFA